MEGLAAWIGWMSGNAGCRSTFASICARWGFTFPSRRWGSAYGLGTRGWGPPGTSTATMTAMVLGACTRCAGAPSTRPCASATSGGRFCSTTRRRWSANRRSAPIGSRASSTTSVGGVLGRALRHPQSCSGAARAVACGPLSRPGCGCRPSPSRRSGGPVRAALRPRMRDPGYSRFRFSDFM